MARAVPVDFLIGGLTDASGNPLSGGKIYTYSAGTTSPKDTWQDHLKTSPHANPIILDAQGKKLVFADGAYKFRIDDSAGVTLYTHDNLLFGFDDGAYVYLGTSGGAATAQTASATPAISSYVAGQVFRMIVGGGLGSTGTTPTAHTLNINGLGAKNIVRNDGSSNPVIGTWVAGAMMELMYDGTSFRIMNDPTDWQTWSPTLTGFSVNPAGASYRYKVIGRLCYINIYQPNAGTSNATSFSISLPITAANNASYGCVPYSTTDNGAAQTTPAQAVIAAGGSTVILAKSISGAGGAWTNANGKAASLSMFYEI